MASPYPYQPLDLPHETRFLTLLPSNDGSSDVICTLTNARLDSPEPYSALSYCWSKSVAGEPSLTYPVHVTEADGTVRETTAATLRDHPGLGWIYFKHGGLLPTDCSIIMDGVTVPVGGELHRALVVLRKRLVEAEKKPLRIWVDALCINQHDIRERNEHVKMARRVFAGAQTVQVWFGPVIGIEQDAFNALAEVRRIFYELHPKMQRLPEGQKVEKGSLLLLNHPAWYSIGWNALATFLNRAWLERIWVVQEIAYAKKATVYGDRFEIPWDELSGWLAKLQAYQSAQLIPHPVAMTRITFMSRLCTGRRAELHKNPLLLLEQLRDFKSTVAHDKIYSVIGLLDPPAFEMVEVDYTKSAESVFTDFAVHHLEKGDINILYHCYQSSNPTTLNLPSWVPDWTRPGWVSPFYMRSQGTPFADAAGSTKPSMVLDRSSGVLRVMGRALDAIAVVDGTAKIPLTKFDLVEMISCEDMSPRERTKDYFARTQGNRLAEWEAIMRLAFPSLESYSNEKFVALWRTFMFNRTRDGRRLGDEGMYPLDFLMILWWMHWNMAPEGTKHHSPFFRAILPQPIFTLFAMYLRTGGNPENFDTILGGHSKWTYHRRFFVSEAGRYGWALDGARVGDKVVLFYGCSAPFVVRELQDGTVQIVGDCYIHGLMDGEALAGDNFAETEFVIS